MTFNINPNCTELIKQGKCKADCCGIVPMPDRYWQRLKKLVKDKEYTVMPFGKIEGQKHIVPMTEDLKCIFLNSDYKCLIYKSPMKPKICNMFGTCKNDLACPYINEDKKELMDDIKSKRINRLMQLGKDK